ncbi:MAG: nitronate monooxygenase [Gammaproteobacteria bacterium]|nr:nitronate monooxygenase [Gammaproteobacteria bacterium]
MKPDPGFLQHLGITLPIIQAPMAGACGAQMVIAVCRAGGLGSLPCAMLSKEQIFREVKQIRSHTDRPFNLNFFCHGEPDTRHASLGLWKQRLAPYYRERGLRMPDGDDRAVRQAFNDEMCRVVEKVRPAVVSFHFGLPGKQLLERVKSAGSLILSSATTTREARWLESRGVDAVIAQGAEAGGHRGLFLGDSIATQSGTMTLVPQIADAIGVPVIAAGGIGDGRTMAAAFALGACCTQIGTAYLYCPESTISRLHREALLASSDESTALTNVYTGRPARGIVNRLLSELGPISDAAPPFPLAAADLAPLRAASEADGNTDFTPLWSGQGAGLGKHFAGISATELTVKLASQAGEVLANMNQ